jgi:hypothetical protein
LEESRSVVGRAENPNASAAAISMPFAT